MIYVQHIIIVILLIYYFNINEFLIDGYSSGIKDYIEIAI